jgi:hypothetical protein
MNKDRQVSIQQAMHKLEQYGFQECTQAASRQDGIQYLCAFERLFDEEPVCYCCVTVDDLLALLSLVEASTSP